MINVKVQGSQSESNSNIVRRFSRRTRNSGVVQKKREDRYRNRPHSDTKKKKERLRYLDRIEEVDKLIKLGKLPDRRRRN